MQQSHISPGCIFNIVYFLILICLRYMLRSKSLVSFPSHALSLSFGIRCRIPGSCPISLRDAEPRGVSQPQPLSLERTAAFLPSQRRLLPGSLAARCPFRLRTLLSWTEERTSTVSRCLSWSRVRGKHWSRLLLQFAPNYVLLQTTRKPTASQRGSFEKQFYRPEKSHRTWGRQQRRSSELFAL